MQLRGATVLITGGARRLGREVTLALARAGAHVVVCYRGSATPAGQTVAEARALGVRALAVQADVADPHQVAGLVERVLDDFSRIDLFIAGASVFQRTPLCSLSHSEWQEAVRNNLDVFAVPALRIGPIMKRQGHGCIIALADVAGLRPWVDYAPYSVAKSGVIALVQALARELAPEVRVNAIAPGPILIPADGDEGAFQREIERTLVRRCGEPGDVAEAVLFLARVEFITGVVLPVDGGRLLAG